MFWGYKLLIWSNFKLIFASLMWLPRENSLQGPRQLAVSLLLSIYWLYNSEQAVEFQEGHVETGWLPLFLATPSLGCTIWSKQWLRSAWHWTVSRGLSQSDSVHWASLHVKGAVILLSQVSKINTHPPINMCMSKPGLSSEIVFKKMNGNQAFPPKKVQSLPKRNAEKVLQSGKGGVTFSGRFSTGIRL